MGRNYIVPLRFRPFRFIVLRTQSSEMKGTISFSLSYKRMAPQRNYPVKHWNNTSSVKFEVPFVRTYVPSTKRKYPSGFLASIRSAFIVISASDGSPLPFVFRSTSKSIWEQENNPGMIEQYVITDFLFRYNFSPPFVPLCEPIWKFNTISFFANLNFPKNNIYLNSFNRASASEMFSFSFFHFYFSIKTRNAIINCRPIILPYQIQSWEGINSSESIGQV